MEEDGHEVRRPGGNGATDVAGVSTGDWRPWAAALGGVWLGTCMLELRRLRRIDAALAARP